MSECENAGCARQTEDPEKTCDGCGIELCEECAGVGLFMFCSACSTEDDD